MNDIGEKKATETNKHKSIGFSAWIFMFCLFLGVTLFQSILFFWYLIQSTTNQPQAQQEQFLSTELGVCPEQS